MQIGTQVTISNADYRGESAIVVGHETNLLGQRLVEVRLESGRKTVFYPWELQELK